MRQGDRGSVTAEFAVVVPAVLLVVALSAGTLSATSRLVRLEQAAAQSARLVARGEDAGRAADVVTAIAGSASTAIRAEGDLVCVDVSAALAAPLPLVALRASSCALSDGR